MSKINVLVFPAGEVNPVEIHNALATCVNIEVYGASSIDRHGGYVFKNYISNIPKINEPNFFDEFNKLIDDKKIDCVFPTHDTVAEFFAENLHKIKAKVICANKETASICRDKQKTFDLFKKFPFCPKIYNDISSFPVFIKPRKGAGGVGSKLIKTQNDIPKDINIKDYVICEYLPNEEYTVDCLTDRNGKLRVVMPRSRKRLMAGISVSGSNEKLTEEIKYIADTINDKLKFNGLWYFQIKKDDNNKFKLLEISTRCAGTMCLTRAMGINLPLLSVYNIMGYDFDVFQNPYNVKLDRTLISRYKIDYEYDTVYFDFDDTLIINDKVHLPSISFLYQCKNNNKKIILITRHAKDLYESFRKYSISLSLFDEIIHIKKTDEKINFIKPNKAIFIDNAYAERKKVFDKFGIPVFDVDNLEVLFDWRY